MLRSRATLVSQGTPYAEQASQRITECDHVRCEVRLQKGGAGAPAATPRPPTPGPQNLANGGLLGWASAGPRGWVHQNGQLWDATRRESSVGINNWGCRPPAWAICMYVVVWQRSKHEFKKSWQSLPTFGVHSGEILCVDRSKNWVCRPLRSAEGRSTMPTAARAIAHIATQRQQPRPLRGRIAERYRRGP